MKITALTRQLATGFTLAALAAVVIQGCGGGGYGGGSAYNPPPPPPPNPSPSPGPVIHVNFFGGGNGSINMGAPFNVVTGFTQQAHAQVMGFSPGEMITITNNDTTAHTVNVFSAYPTPGPQSTATDDNGGTFGPGFLSGPIAAGGTIGPFMVTNTTGNLFIICGIHFADGMQDGIVVQVGATPGPEATPAPQSSGGGGCKGYGC
ncbi:MAG TPA: hypothetical protein VFO25_04825 [Candidatus Eremiobacteraceae bacterium]|nr:hypothetical protein [Candidatus Eremiobacteraceae bacterium]